MAKIAFLGNTSWSMYNFRMQLFNSLSENHEVIIIAPADEYSQYFEQANLTFYPVNIKSKGSNPLQDIQYLNQLYQILNKEKPDIIYSYTIKPNIYSSLIAQILNIPSIAITTGLGYVFTNKNVVSRIAKMMYKFALRFPKEVWFLNQDDRQTFLDQKLVSKNKVYSIPGEGVDLRHFKSVNGSKEANPTFLYMGRLIWEKGFKEYCDAARITLQQHPEAKFLVVGFLNVDNPSAVPEQYVKDLVNEGIIEYLGPTDDVRPFIEQSSCLVFPSYYSEGIPRVLMEASAMQTPIITTDNVGCRDVVLNEKSGYITKIKDSKDLANKIEKFLSLSLTDRKKMGEIGRDYMQKNYSLDSIIELYEKSLERNLS